MTGVHTIPAADYHLDLVSLDGPPSLSSSIAKILCMDSPAHARAAHPRLNPDRPADDEAKFDLGTAAHALLLEGQSNIVIVDAKDWRTNAAKDARDAARALGKTPLLAHVWADVLAMATAAREQLDAHQATPALFVAGLPEQTLVWEEEGGVVCRARLDWLHDSHLAIDDLKTTSGSANPDAWSRNLFGMGFDIQVAFYLRGLKAVTGKDAIFRFAVQENYPPYALSVIALGPDAMLLAEKKVIYALESWRTCLASNLWPAYPSQVCYASLPAYIESAWLEKELR